MIRFGVARVVGLLDWRLVFEDWHGFVARGRVAVVDGVAALDHVVGLDVAGLVGFVCCGAFHFEWVCQVDGYGGVVALSCFKIVVVPRFG